MNIFFEESGAFKAGTVLSRQDNAFQVELPGGRRLKVKGRDVFFEFPAPTAVDLMQTASARAQDIDLDFLWQCASDDIFHFSALADEYFGARATSENRAALALRVHHAPVYFRRKGRGQYQRAPEAQLKAALAALERRQQQAEQQAAYEAELKARRWPAAFDGKALMLLTKPDKNAIESKALNAAAAALGISAGQLMLDCGAIASVRALHEARFLAEYFPRGTGFGMAESYAVKAPLDELPHSSAPAFSIDDTSTTEIDDAFSVESLTDGRLRIGIHIAAPALGIARGDPIDAQARTRLSTVYAPGDKITMLPDSVVERFTLKEGGERPAVSLYLIVDGTAYDVIATETRIERVYVAHNLRRNTLEAAVTEQTLAARIGDYPHRDEIAALWPFVQKRYELRQQARSGYGLKREAPGIVDFNFNIEGERVIITPRRRDSPLNQIVAELAILTNSIWGEVLAKHGIPGIYRAQQRAFGPSRTRMQITPAPHEGLGVAQYAWSTSPLRRYTDLVNQWQLLACVRNGVTAKLVAPFRPQDADLYAIAQNFDETYSAYLDYQRRMERFWCLRWLKQEQRTRVHATLVKENLVRFDEIPLHVHIPGLGTHALGARLLLEIVALDEVMLEVSCRLVQVLNPNAPRDDHQISD